MPENQPPVEVYFPRGLPGFEDQNRFVLIEREALAPIVLLESVATPDLHFLAVSVWLVDPAYQIGITEDDLSLLNLEHQPQSGDGVTCLAILSALEGEPFTANLLAPVVIHPRTRVGVQAVRNDARYSHRVTLETACL
jgi:flagellar assembly factor FliW